MERRIFLAARFGNRGLGVAARLSGEERCSRPWGKVDCRYEILVPLLLARFDQLEIWTTSHPSDVI
jgi:hypothetical protein